MTRGVRRQRTVEIEQQKKQPGYSVKNIVYHARLVKRAKQWVKRTSPAYRFRHITAAAIKKINDKCHDLLQGRARFLPLSSASTSSTNPGSPPPHNPLTSDLPLNDFSCSSSDSEPEPTQREGLFARQLTRSKTKNTHLRHRYNSLSQRIASSINNLIELIPIVNPNDAFKLVWDTLLCFIVIILSVITPMYLAVQEFHILYFIRVNAGLALIILICIVDIFVNLNTAFFSRGKIEERRLEILKEYFAHQSGMYDMLIVQGLVFQYANSGSEITRQSTNWSAFEYIQTILLVTLFYIKVMRLQRYAFKIEEIFALKKRSLHTLSLLKLLLFILMASHALACLWLYIGREKARDGGVSWLSGMDTDGWGE